MRAHRPLILLIAALGAGCADPEPFVNVGGSISPSYSKPLDPVIEYGRFNICYSDATPWAEVEALAAERCGAYGLTARATTVTRWQCRATSPHIADFFCYDPEMVTAAGSPVNPFDHNAVKAWEAKTGKKAKPHNTLSGNRLTVQTPAAIPGPPTDTPPPATAPADSTATPAPPPSLTAAPTPALTPADIATRPAISQPEPLPAAPAPTATSSGPAYPVDNFTLPQGSWGDAFKE